MSGWLRALGVLVMLLGIVVGGWAGRRFASDVEFHEIVDAYARHPTHAIFQAEYWAASARHWGFLAVAVGSGFVGLTVGSLLLGVAEVLRRLRDR